MNTHIALPLTTLEENAVPITHREKAKLTKHQRKALRRDRPGEFQPSPTGAQRNDRKVVRHTDHVAFVLLEASMDHRLLRRRMERVLMSPHGLDVDMFGRLIHVNFWQESETLQRQKNPGERRIDFAKRVNDGRALLFGLESAVIQGNPLTV